jgi:hypothetical protein
MAKDCSKCPYKLAAKFKKPTTDEIANYARTIGYTTIDVGYFFWKNESVGWVDNRGLPYKNWKGVVQTWFRAAKRRGEIKPETKTFKERFEENKNES